MQRAERYAMSLTLLMLASVLSGSLGAPTAADEDTVADEAPDWPAGSAAYDNMVSLTQFGYRRIDTSANENARDWLVEQLQEMDYEVDRQPFTTAECSNCENIVVTINGTLTDEWMVVGAHHDAICYTMPPISGITYPGCTSSGAYDDGTGSGALLELARTFAEWNITPEHTWKLGWWDYEEWQGIGSSENGGQGSLNFVEQQIPDDVRVTYVNLDMFALNWPVPTPAAAQAAGCDEDYWKLYMFTSPVDDWSYYEDRGLEVTDEMQQRAEQFQTDLKEVNSNLSHPTEWVQVIDDTKGNSDHFNFIMNNHTATWFRGQHEYIVQEGDACEQTPKHSQTDSVTVLNTMAGGRSNVESGLQTGLDVIATIAWWDRNASIENGSAAAGEGQQGIIDSLVDILKIAFFVAVVAVIIGVVAILLMQRRQEQGWSGWSSSEVDGEDGGDGDDDPTGTDDTFDDTSDAASDDPNDDPTDDATDGSADDATDDGTAETSVELVRNAEIDAVVDDF